MGAGRLIMTVKTPARLGIRHACVHRGNPSAGYHHSYGVRRPNRKTCQYCRGPIWVERGYWGVFLWLGNGRYPIAEALSLHSRENVAERVAAEDPREPVVRWIHIDFDEED